MTNQVMHRSDRKRGRIDREAAETIAAQGLAFLAQNPGRLARFFLASGLAPGDVRARADTPELLAAVLEHLAEDESALLVFAAGAQIAPEAIGQAAGLLRGLSEEGAR
jgi:uncharacterized protein DUF3572